jgi:hypothetical protein
MTLYGVTMHLVPDGGFTCYQSLSVGMGDAPTLSSKPRRSAQGSAGWHDTCNDGRQDGEAIKLHLIREGA